MDHRELKKLVQLMNDNELVELEIEQEGLRVSLKKALPPATSPLALAAPAYGALAQPAYGVALPAASGNGPLPTAVEEAPPEAPPGTELILSPMVGTFYRRPSPDSEPYVDVGSAVDEESIICIVEAMKVNNELKAERSGTIIEILAEDGQPVEYDQPLFRVKVG